MGFIEFSLIKIVISSFNTIRSMPRGHVTLFTFILFFIGVHDCFAIFLDKKVTNAEDHEGLKKTNKTEYNQDRTKLPPTGHTPGPPFCLPNPFPSINLITQ
ncbi:MAG: hypothetical protein WBP45_10405 [Daejeonella sp.]